MKHPRVTKRECEVRRCFTVHQHWLNSFLLRTQSRDDWKPEPELQWFIHPLPTISIISKHSSLLNVNIFFHSSLFLEIFIDSKDPWAPIDTEQGPHTLHILYRILNCSVQDELYRRVRTSRLRLMLVCSLTDPPPQKPPVRESLSC